MLAQSLAGGENAEKRNASATASIVKENLKNIFKHMLYDLTLFDFLQIGSKHPHLVSRFHSKKLSVVEIEHLYSLVV